MSETSNEGELEVERSNSSRLGKIFGLEYVIHPTGPSKIDGTTLREGRTDTKRLPVNVND